MPKHKSQIVFPNLNHVPQRRETMARSKKDHSKLETSWRMRVWKDKDIQEFL